MFVYKLGCFFFKKLYSFFYITLRFIYCFCMFVISGRSVLFLFKKKKKLVSIEIKANIGSDLVQYSVINI